MGVVKARLKIILQANEVVVAESEDQQLWQDVLAGIDGTVHAGKLGGDSDIDSDIGDDSNSRKAITKFAEQLGITIEEVLGSCDPSMEPPYIHLDKHHWENFKKNTPKRGPNAVSAIQLAMTLLALWKGIAKLEGPAMKEAKDVIATIGAEDKNPARSVKNCEWLQERHSRVQLNPSLISKAISVAKVYCQKPPTSE